MTQKKSAITTANQTIGGGNTGNNRELQLAIKDNQSKIRSSITAESD